MKNKEFKLIKNGYIFEFNYNFDGFVYGKSISSGSIKCVRFVFWNVFEKSKNEKNTGRS